MKAIIGRKVGMSQIFDEKGHVIPVTVIEAGPCVVTQKKTSEKDGYEAVQLAQLIARQLIYRRLQHPVGIGNKQQKRRCDEHTGYPYDKEHYP